ncbi:hypothetical protein BJ138DRAFT_820372 [Hygrophoropsis aurantiaca]|uniref:Uncharacterized protein n=1 Tax=Hygrophoropsis aurantiaca TaxID=72124 RepID=A0ACB8AFS7_9AGAM|nr:hypothetical protein BJ138DRAFT_820372 [Hygrophoropsis aurantiaca]
MSRSRSTICIDATYGIPVILPNEMGRPPSVLEPIGVEHIPVFRDNEARGPLLVQILIYDGGDKSKVAPRDRHWAIAWMVGEMTAVSWFVDGCPVAAHRILELKNELASDGTGPLPYLTNWGPRTTSIGLEDQAAVHVDIATLSYSQRQVMEGIARTEPVRPPNGNWNCQNWVASILRRCEEAGVLTPDQRRYALNQTGVPWRNLL